MSLIKLVLYNSEYLTNLYVHSNCTYNTNLIPRIAQLDPKQVLVYLFSGF